MGAQMALHRLSGRSTLLTTAGAVIFATLAAWAERHADAVTAPDYALRGAAFGLAIPLATLAIVTVALSRNRLEHALGAIATLGGNRRGCCPRHACRHQPRHLPARTRHCCHHDDRRPWQPQRHHRERHAHGRPGLARSLAPPMAASTASLSSYGKRGGGRIVALLADLILGPLAGTAAVVFPRAHALNLLGATPVLELPQIASTAVLLAMAAVFATLAALRTRA